MQGGGACSMKTNSRPEKKKSLITRSFISIVSIFFLFLFFFVLSEAPAQPAIDSTEVVRRHPS